MNRELLGTVALLLLVSSCSGKLNVGDKASGGNGGTTGGIGGTGHVPVSPSTGGLEASSGFGGGGTGGSPVGPIPGTVGALCIPGGLALEAQGTAAEAEVRTLDRCDEGYTCSTESVCVLTKACGGATSGDCIVYTAPGAGGVGAGGMASGPPTTGGAPWNTGGAGNEPAKAGNEPAKERAAITGLTSDDSHLYWIAYGSRDRLGNFQNDGALAALSLEDGTTTTLASELPGPIAVGVTSSHAYLLVDGAPLVGSITHHRLLRVALTGGTPEVVQDDPEVREFSRGFVAAGPQGFWVGPGGLQTMSADETAPRILVAVPDITFDGIAPVASDNSHLYYHVGSSIWRVPVGGGTAQQVVSPGYAFGVRNDFVYGVEDVYGGLMLDRAPAGGGAWKRARALGASSAGWRLQFVADRYFVGMYLRDAIGNLTQRGVLTALLSSDSPPVRLLERARRDASDNLWVGTAKALFWSDGSRIYSRPFDPEL